jgi:type IV pilus assembly protein PilV
MKSVRRPRRRPSGERGIALIEALVGILIFAFGIIGLVGLQVAMTRAQGTAKFRADASYLSSQMLGTMWADRNNLAQYNTANCASYTLCKDWKDKVAATLPSGGFDISASASTGLVALTVTWSTTQEGTHTHVVTTSIN